MQLGAWHGSIGRRGFLGLVLAGMVALGLPSGAAAGEGPLKVVATTGMIADAARVVGGDQVTVRALMGPGVDPHSYRQTRTDILALAKADMVLWHGLYLEAQMEEFLLELGRSERVVAVAETLPPDRLIAHDVYTEKFDPHVWMDPTLWTGVVATVRDALIAARPADEAAFRRNAEAHIREIEALADYAKRVTASVPDGSRVLVTAHDAFNYFGAAFGFEVVGIQGISTASEAGLKRISDLAAMLAERRIAAVFVESSVSDRNIRALIEGAAAKGHEVRIGGELYSDAMGVPGTYEGTYIGMIDHNVTTIARALGGDVPARGMSGLLN